MKQVAALRIRVLSDNLHKFWSTAWHLPELEHLLDNLNGFSKGVKTAILDVLPHFNVKCRGNATDLTEACRRLRGQELVATRNIWIDNAKSFTHRRANICQLGIDIVRIGPRAQRLWLVLSSLAAMVRPTALILLFLGTLTVAERWILSVFYLDRTIVLVIETSFNVIVLRGLQLFDCRITTWRGRPTSLDNLLFTCIGRAGDDQGLWHGTGRVGLTRLDDLLFVILCHFKTAGQLFGWVLVDILGFWHALTAWARHLEAHFQGTFTRCLFIVQILRLLVDDRFPLQVKFLLSLGIDRLFFVGCTFVRFFLLGFLKFSEYWLVGAGLCDNLNR